MISRKRENQREYHGNEQSVVLKNSQKDVLKDLPKEGKSENKKTMKNTSGFSKGTIIAILAAFLVGAGSFWGVSQKLAADQAEMMAYIEAQLTELRTTNDATIAQMKETMGKMEANFSEITALLEETGAAIGSSSAESREAISKRIETLDKQLKELQASLKIIQEDSNGRQ